MCPVCTVTVVAGLGISRLLGIDDLITSLWIGAFILSFSFVMIDWINKKWPKWKFGFNIWWKVTIIANVYLLALFPLKLNHAIGIVLNRIWGIDKIILGTIIGSLVFLAGAWADKKAREIHGGKQFFIYQKVIFPVLALVLTSVIFWFVLK
jgi:hypothetical protein